MHLRDGILKWVRANTDERDDPRDVAAALAYALASLLRDVTAGRDEAATQALLADVHGVVRQHVLRRRRPEGRARR